MEFPHLKDTQFPYMNNVDVYSFRNTFDYTRWNEKTDVTLVNVLWNSDYKNVVDFENDEKRDAYFNLIPDKYKIKLEQAARIVPEGFIKLPIPYDVMAKYNYLYVDMPIATSANQPIDWEEINGIRRWYFFIDSIVYRAANTTEVRLIPDVWTNFHNNVEINYMMLERGHAPVAFSNVDDYLSNPMAHNEYLLAPDVNFGETSIVKNSNYIPFGNGTKYLVMISTIGVDNIESIGSVTNPTSDSWTNPTYSDVDVRYGYQLQVNGYNFGDAGDYSNLNMPVDNSVNDILPNNVTAYAIEAANCYGNGSFLETIRVRCPHFMQSILAAFVVSEDMINLSSLTYTIAGYNVYTVIGNEKTIDIKLNKSMFNFPKEYANFAKLYTFPYSYIEMTDNDGKKVSVKIEETNNLACNMISSVAFPFLNIRAFFTGIAGNGNEKYTWKRVDGTTANKSISNSDWSDYCFDWNIPTYALYMDGKTNYNLHNYNQLMMTRRNALVNYHNSVRDANTACENAKALALTAETNAKANADTLVANMANTTYMQRANMDLAIDTLDANNQQARYYGSEIVGRNMDMVTNDATIANACITATTKEENQQTTSTTTNTNQANITAGATTSALSMAGVAGGLLAIGATGGVALAGAAGAAAIGTYSTAYNAQTCTANATIITQCNSTVAENTRTRNTRAASNANTTSSGNNESNKQLNIIQTKNTKDCMDGQQDNTIDCERKNTDNSANTMRANAERTRGTSVDNSNYTQEVAILNAKEILENAQDRARAIYNDARNNIPVQVGSYSGNYAPDYMENRGIQIKIRTENDSCIRQVGDMFARYGYALNQVWNVKESGLSLMKHFTYWKASDIWIDDANASNNSVNMAIENIFRNGVTIWRYPEEIGKVSIYAN